MNQATSDNLLQIVSRTKERAEQAMAEFDTASAQLQYKTESKINLYGGTAVSQVADIAADARNICDNLYTTLQTLVRIADESCRPLLNEQPSLSSVKEVYKLIKWLNEESKIKANFSAEVNDQSLGNIVSGRYIPTMESKMIESYWEDRYDTWADWVFANGSVLPGSITETPEAAALKQSLNAVSERTDFTPTAEELTYKAACNRWQAAVAEAVKQRDQEIEHQIMEEKSRLEEKAKAYYDKTVARQKQIQEEQLQRIAAAQAEMKKLSFFKMKAMIAQQEIINDADQRYKDAVAELAAAEEEYQKDMALAAKRAEEKRYTIEKQVKNSFVPPQAPQKPASIMDIQSSNLATQKAILACMEKGVLYSIEDMQREIPAIMNMSIVRLSSILRQLIPNQIVRVEQDNKRHFKLAE